MRCVCTEDEHVSRFGQVKINYEKVVSLFILYVPKDTFQTQQRPSNKTHIDRFVLILVKRRRTVNVNDSESGIAEEVC